MHSSRLFLPGLLILTVLFSGIVWAQAHPRFAKRGAIELGGLASFQTSSAVIAGKTSGDPTITLTVAPTAGIFVADGIELGVIPLGIGYSSTDDYSTTSLSLMGFAAYNFTTPQGILYPFVEGQAGYTGYSVTMTSPTHSTSTVGGFSWAGRVGLKIAVTDGGLLNVSGLYSQVALNPKGATERTGYDTFSFAVGFTVWL
jgi:hypothetical protein